MGTLKYRQHFDNSFEKAVEQVPLIETKDGQIQIATKFGKEKFISILQDLYDTHFQDKERIGVGLAANQIGYPFSIALMYINPVRAEKKNCESYALTFWVNASYSPSDHEKINDSEGCYSVQQIEAEDKSCLLIGEVPRFKKINVKGYKIKVNLDAHEKITNFEITKVESECFENFPARVMQHELDHVNTKKSIFFFNYLKNKIADVKVATANQDPRTSENSKSNISMRPH